MAEEKTARCLSSLAGSCEKASMMLSELREALGKGRGKGGGMARVIRRVTSVLEEGLRSCIEGCFLAGGEDALRCGFGEALERLIRGLEGVAVRLEHVPRLSEGVEEELARMLLDVVSLSVEAFCSGAREAERLLS